MIYKIISGGQSGVDRAALDFAISHSIDYGGWCPRSGWAEDMVEPPGLLNKYDKLFESNSADPAIRTEKNICSSDYTMIVLQEDRGEIPFSKGTNDTIKLVKQYSKPHLIVFLSRSNNPLIMRDWLLSQDKRIVLNVAGPRESESPGIYERTFSLLEELYFHFSELLFKTLN